MEVGNSHEGEGKNYELRQKFEFSKSFRSHIGKIEGGCGVALLIYGAPKLVLSI